MAAIGKYTPNRVDKVCTLLRKGVTIRGAAHGAGICEKTYYQWRKQKPGFAENADKAISDAEAALVEIALEGTKRNPQLAIQLLERRFADWARHSRQENNVNANVSTTISPSLLSAFAASPERVRRN